MPQSTAVLTHMAGGYVPFATGWQHTRRLPYEGIPGFDTPLGMMAGMAMQPAAYRMFGQVGMMPMGVGHDQNVFDRLMNQRFSQMQLRSMQEAAQADRDSYMQTFRGLAALTGTPFGAEQRRAAMSLSNIATTFAPALAETMPEFLDQMGGMRGSATVMARRMIDAGRYRVDPVTGRMGMSAETVGAASRRLFDDLYSAENLPEMRGITAGKAGSLFNELQLRGLIGTAASEGRQFGYRGDDPRGATMRALDDLSRRSPNDLKRAADATGVDISGGINKLSAADLDKLNLDPRVSDKIRSFDVERIKKAIQGYTGVVTAMRDIFGDMGHANAPMQQLMAGVEAMTAGSMAQLDPGKLSGMVRQTYNLAKQSGVSLDNALILQQHAGAKAQAMGLESIFAVHATQGSLGFGGAYRGQGHAAHTAWGAMNADQVQQLDANLRVQAAGSSMANRMAVAMRLRDQGGGFEKGSDAERYTSAINAGLNSWTDSTGKTRSLMTTDKEFIQMMSGNGRTEGDVRSLLGQRDTNREYVEKYRMTDIVRRAQGTDELHPFIGNRMQETLYSRLVGQGVSAKEARDAAAGISQTVTKRMFDMSPAEFADTTTRNQMIGGFIEEELARSGKGDLLKNMTPEQRDQFFKTTADSFYGSANRGIGTSQYRAFGNLQNIHRLTNKTTLDEADRQQMQARFSAEMQEALSPLGHGSILQRAVSSLQNYRPGDPKGMTGFLAEALGGVKIDDINRSLVPHFEKIRDKQSAIEALQDKIRNEKDPAARGQLMEQLETARRELNSQAKDLAKMGEQFGLFGTDALSHEDVSRAIGTTRSVGGTRADVAGIRGGFGHEVNQRQIDEVKRASGKANMTDDEARAIARANRRSLPYRASDEDIDKVLADSKNTMTRSEAADLANQRLRSQRLGIDKVEVEAHMKAKGLSGTQGEMAAINELMDARASDRFKVSDADRDDFRKVNPNLPKDANVDEMILKQRQGAQRDRFKQFFGSEAGAAFRETVDMAGQDVETVSQKLLQGQGGVARYGTRAIEMSKTLRSNQQRLRELALYHAGGDMAKLLAGNYNIDTHDARGQDVWRKVHEEVTSLQGQQEDLLREIQEQGGQPGKRFQLGNEDEARKIVRDRMIAKGMSAAEADRLTVNNIPPEQQARVRAYAGEHGSDANARKYFGFGKTDNLNDHQLSMVAALRHGVGNVEEASLIFGRDRWSKLSEAEKTSTLATMRAGVSDKTRAMGLLGLTEKDLANDPSGEHANRLATVMAGLSSELHAKQIAGSDDPDKIRGAKMGIASEDWARDRMGLPKDLLSREMRDEIHKQRETMGNKEEAMRILGYEDESKLGVFGKARLADLTKKVGIVRGLDSEQEALLTNYNQRDKRIADMAKRRGVTVDQLGKMTLPKAEKELLDRLNNEKGDDMLKIKHMADKLGLSPDDLIGATSVHGQMMQKAAEAQRKADSDPKKTLKGILEQYGYNPGDEFTAEQKDMLKQMEGTRGRAMSGRILESAKHLRGVSDRSGGEGLGGVDKMSAEYFAAIKSGDKAKIAEFQKKYKFEMDAHGQMTGKGGQDWSSFEKDMQFQQQTGFLSFGRQRDERGFRTKTGDTALKDLFTGTLKGSGAAAEGSSAPAQRIEGRLDVHIKADGNGFGELSGSVGGGRNFPVPGG